MAQAPRPFIGLAAGIAAGLVAAAAMSAFQSQAAKLLPDDGGDADPATVKAADKVAKAVTGKKVPEAQREAAGETVHYIVGAVIGGIYGVITEYQPDARAGFGSAFGVATAALLDEGAVPALDLGPAPDDTPAETHVYGVASHLVFGVVLEGVRWLLGGRR